MRRVVVAAAAALALVGCDFGAPPEDATGSEIYAQLCARCHDADLSGGVGPALGPGSVAAQEGRDYMEFTIRNGRGRMPSFSSLSDEQMSRLLEYLLEEQGE